MLRVSDYTIFADFSTGETLLIHGYSGAWDTISQDVAKGLLQCSSNNLNKECLSQKSQQTPSNVSRIQFIQELDEDVRNHLVKRGYLTDMSVQAEQALVSKITHNLHDLAMQDPPSYVFTLSYDCNLCCSYCFQNSLRSQTRACDRHNSMSREMADKIFSLMPVIDARYEQKVSKKSGQRKRRITLFGGEPLLKRFKNLAQHIVHSAMDLGPVSISAVTNGTELHHHSDLLGPDKISFLQIPLDGSPEIHNKRRFGPQGQPTFQAIADNIDLALSLNVEVKVRVNTDKDNIQSLPTLADIMDQRGWFGNPLFSAYSIPVHETSGSKHKACGFGSWHLGRRLEELADDYPLLKHIAGPDMPWQRIVRKQLEGSGDPLFNYQPSYCGAHAQTWVFDPSGDIYACWERAGLVDERIGKVTGDGKLYMFKKVENKWRSRTIASNSICGQSCPYALYCGGGCALLAQLNNGKLHSHFCDDFDKRFKALAASEVKSLQMKEFIQTARSISFP